ncbi:MAG TPA: metallophosphoesterase [Candidatus Limnocylindrales bacterium]|nr:metallophosphoesterase [Candidatus Limnocylindrales bacterium]
MNLPSAEPGQENSLLHQILVASDALARVPAALVVVVMGAASLFTGLVWAARTTPAEGLLAGLFVAGACALNWALLAALPRAGRSYGAPVPPALALSGLLALGALGLALLPSLVLLAVWLVAITLTALYATWIAPFRLQVTQQTLVVEGLTGPLRLVHIGDLHVERITSRERRLNRLLEEIKPDLIVFSGDFVNLTYRDDARAEADVRAVIGGWHAPYGVVAVPGTPRVEPLARVQAFVNGIPSITLLLNQWHTAETPVGPLHIAGMVTTHHLEADRAALADLLRQWPASGPRLLLTHAPDVAPEAAAAGFDVYLCGHTHGGQIVLPLVGPLFSGSAYSRRFVRGRYSLGQMTLFVTRGLGMEGWGAPRARLSCAPEITVWTMLPSAFSQ